MLLKEFIYFDRGHSDMISDPRYSSDRDISVLSPDDLRKTKLTLGMLNTLRKAGDANSAEKQEDLILIRKMYAAPPAEGQM
jgi:hypothetical protein